MTLQTKTPPGPRRGEKPRFLTKTTFDQFDLPLEVVAGLDEAGFTHCTPIQAQALPVALTGADVAGQAQTGTGKTAAFLVTIFTRLLRLGRSDSGLPAALIVAPTRELALQIHDEAALLGRHTGLKMVAVFGGIGYQEQAETLRRGVDVVICTPGRIIDYLKQGVFKTTQIKFLVIDEADRLLDLGFIKDLRYLLRRLPPFDQRQSMLFSATLSYRILELTYEYMNLPEFISVTPEDLTVEGVTQSLFHVGRDEKLPLLLGLLKREDWTRVLIFVNTKAGVEWLAQKLKGNGYPAEAITGDLPQRQRLKLMQRFKDGQLKILVATDVASRGIHVEDISHVINYDLPQDVENYVHRVGRTARVGKTGTALTLACEEYVFHLEPLEEYLGYALPVVWPEEDWFEEDRSGSVSRKRRGRASAGGGARRARRGREAKPGKPEVKDKAKTKTETKDKAKDKARASTRPGGIFGLVPGQKGAAAEPAEGEAEEPKKKRRRRPRRKKKSGGPGNASGPADGQG